MVCMTDGVTGDTSLSARRAWIEISDARKSAWLAGSLSARRAWIEIIVEYLRDNTGIKSLSARRAWIEIRNGRDTTKLFSVALRKESVDRNRDRRCCRLPARVALRKESVDRNIFYGGAQKWMLTVALRKESVDRNWMSTKKRNPTIVALRKESVDRNTQRRDFKALGLRRSPQGERG